MTLATSEFIRRFLNHVLPKGFHRIRYYGLLAKSSCVKNLASVRAARRAKLQAVADDSGPTEPSTTAHPCPCCGSRMIIIETFAPGCQPHHRPIGDNPRHQNRRLMITAIRLRRCRADLLSLWSSTGCADTHSNAPYQRQSEPAMATLGGYLNRQHLLLLPPDTPLLALERIVIRRTHLRRHPNPHNRVRGTFRPTSPAGSFFWRLSDAGTAHIARSFKAGIRNPARKQNKGVV
jgi:Putative transposase